METSQQTPEAPAVQISPVESWHAPLNKVTLVSKILAAIIFITLPFAGFWFGLSQQFFEEAPVPVIVDSATILTDTLTKTTPTQPTDVAMAWQTYRSSYGFEIQYPPVWKIVSELGSKKVSYPTTILLSVSFGTGTFGNEGYDGELFVSAYDKQSISVEQYIKDMGKQFSDRQEKRENLTLNGVPAVKVTVTTPSHPSWIYEAVIVEQQDRFYVMSNGAVKRDSFTDFYKSFKLI